ncbi:MotA/TolQ/ExbB proton channel family protein [Oryzomicrobium terrae]|uniref:Biopolymer transport protein ExbB n=1 Tax=Oryzomicrobium terrae TaxID=1735038 RepID=A0A5C1E5W3_9RHOO|nr:MotA/TolQ/ExbB proton channel family protein [Oryzomicrobium terrae]QEL64322.1 MotA/TolQ/ExbB proton channel family protein [Oryzomicrobium terrae]
MQPETHMNLAGFWAAGDFVSHAVAVLLVVLSIGSWTVILAKGWRVWNLRRATTPALAAFWQARSVPNAIAELEAGNARAFALLARRAEQAANHYQRHHGSGSLAASLSGAEFITQALRSGLTQTSARLENGLTLLASVGSTAPFIGLFGTVWGIYHALAMIGATGQASLDKVAGPVGEALIMTAAGLFVAIPAVLAYNALTRAVRVIEADLDAFAHDLHAFFTTGKPLSGGEPHTGTSHAAPVNAAGRPLAEAA